jgi:arylsulfatase A-like enzyme
VQHQPWDFMAVLYNSIDHFSHMFMEYHPPKPAHISDQDFETYQNVVTACYRFHDLMLRRLLQLAGDRATVLIVSDHGFRTGDDRPKETVRTLEGLSQWHRRQGICVMHGPAIRAGVQLDGASLLDVTPTILTLFGLPVGADMDGRPWLEAIDAEIEPERIASWDDVPGDAGMHPAELRHHPSESHAAIRHLIELGYLNPPDADVEKAMEECLATNHYNLGRALIDAGLAAGVKANSGE